MCYRTLIYTLFICALLYYAFLAVFKMAEEGGGSVTVELPDGTQAILHNAVLEESQGTEQYVPSFSLISYK